MAKSSVTKVNGEQGEQTSDTKEPKQKGRIEFAIAKAQYRNDKGEVVTAVNADGLLIAVPVPIRDDKGKVVYAGFDVRKHIPLKKTHFASIVQLMQYQAFVARIRAAILIKGAEEKEKKAERIAKFGDDDTRRKVTKLAKMQETIKALQEQLTANGVDINDLS